MPLFRGQKFDVLKCQYWHYNVDFQALQTPKLFNDRTQKTPASGIEMPTLSIYEIDPSRNHFSNRENCAIIYVNIIVQT